MAARRIRNHNSKITSVETPLSPEVPARFLDKLESPLIPKIDIIWNWIHLSCASVGTNKNKLAYPCTGRFMWAKTKRRTYWIQRFLQNDFLLCIKNLVLHVVFMMKSLNFYGKRHLTTHFKISNAVF